jgi:hypothetical protein
MAKNPITFAPDIQADPPRRNIWPILAFVVTIALLIPILRDAVAVCYGQWREMLGTPTAVKTPTFDAIGEQVGEVREDVWYHITNRLNRVPWNPRIVLPVAALVMLLAILMIRPTAGFR